MWLIRIKVLHSWQLVTNISWSWKDKKKRNFSFIVYFTHLSSDITPSKPINQSHLEHLKQLIMVLCPSVFWVLFFSDSQLSLQPFYKSWLFSSLNWAGTSLQKHPVKIKGMKAKHIRSQEQKRGPDNSLNHCTESWSARFGIISFFEKG